MSLRSQRNAQVWKFFSRGRCENPALAGRRRIVIPSEERDRGLVEAPPLGEAPHPVLVLSPGGPTASSAPHSSTPYTILWYYHTVEFIESRPFTRKLHQLAGHDAEEVLRAIQSQLMEKPDRGAMVPGLGGVRKARAANPVRGKGKRSGYRYLYLYLENRRHIHLLVLLDKDEQEDASEDQRRQMREWVVRIKNQAGG